MANDDFWGRKDSMWGGETITCKERNANLGVEINDRFRVEKGPGIKLTLVPHPLNSGTWKDSHDKSHPVKVSPRKHTPTVFIRAYSMKVKIKKNDTKPTKLFLVELENGTVAIANFAEHAEGGGADEDIASVER
jgi:hypothetical protein